MEWWLDVDKSLYIKRDPEAEEHELNEADKDRADEKEA